MISKCDKCIHKKTCIDGADFKNAQNCEKYVEEPMTAKEYLSQAYYIEKRIDLLQDELSGLESKLYKCTPSYSNTGHNSSPCTAFEYTIGKAMEYRDRLNAEIDNLIDKKRDIKKTIDRLDNDKEKLILHKRYINFQNFESIAEDLDITPRQVYKIHKKVLEKIKKFIEVQ